jgi:PadR family transcriptional regulator, regulatory protein PadR
MGRVQMGDGAYRLTDKGRKQLLAEESQWKQMAEAVARVLWPAAEES